MSIEAWIEERKLLKLLNASKYVEPDSDPSKGLWTRCDKCDVILYIKHLKENQRVCFGCSYPLQMNSQERVENLLDKGSWSPLDEAVSPCDPLEFHDEKNYTDRLQEAQKRTGLQDAIQTGRGMVDGIPIALGVMDFDFMGGSMGSVVGEKVTRLIEYATQEGLTLVLVCASGGARMQEGVFSLMQMAKISGALQVYQRCANLLYISILTSPTTGGVTASFGMLGDIIFAEPQALIAFAGRRVIEQTLCEDLPEDFQTSEYMLDHGLLDMIVPRRFLTQALSESIRLYKNAPFKKPGRIPFGVQNPITPLLEERIRRQSRIESLPIQDNSSAAEIELYKSASPSRTDDTPAPARNQAVLQPSEPAQLALLPDRSRVEIGQARGSADTLLRRDTVQYREILTSFQTMFSLFSKQLVRPYSVCADKTALEPTQAGSRAESTIWDPASPVRWEGADALSDSFLESFMALSESQTSESKNQRSTVSTEVRKAGVDRAANSPESEEPGLGMTDINCPADSFHESANAPNTDIASRGGTVRSLGERERSLDSGSIYLDFLNKSIELAATECVEWRAFYLDQKIAQRTGFLEDFVRPVSESGGSTRPTRAQNMLFYRSICRGNTPQSNRS